MKGHPLVWHQWYPKWRPDDPQEAMRRVEQRIAEIAARYGETIRRWEVVNEACERHLYADKWCNLPEGYVLRSLNAAAKLFPATDRMMLNEANGSWLDFHEDQSPYYRLIREMLDRGARVDEFGMQLHIFSEKAWQLTLAGKQFAPAQTVQGARPLQRLSAADPYHGDDHPRAAPRARRRARPGDRGAQLLPALVQPSARRGHQLVEPGRWHGRQGRG